MLVAFLAGVGVGAFYSAVIRPVVVTVINWIKAKFS